MAIEAPEGPAHGGLFIQRSVSQSVFTGLEPRKDWVLKKIH